MRHYQKLDTVKYDEGNDTLLLSCGQPEDSPTTLWFGREGLYVSISASTGAFEVALRPRLRDLVSSLQQIKPTERLTAMRIVGTGQAHLELGLSVEGELLLRAVLVADATGYLAVNTVLTPDARSRLFAWLEVENGARV